MFFPPMLPLIESVLSSFALAPTTKSLPESELVPVVMVTLPRTILLAWLLFNSSTETFPVRSSSGFGSGAGGVGSGSTGGTGSGTGSTGGTGSGSGSTYPVPMNVISFAEVEPAPSPASTLFAPNESAAA